MPNQPAIPAPLYIADAGERLLDMLTDVMFERLVAEVEAEEQKKEGELVNIHNPITRTPCKRHSLPNRRLRPVRE